MSAPRKFDWDEAARLRSEDPKVWTYPRMAAHFGVSGAAVFFALHPEARAKQSRNSVAWQRSGTCPECGAPATRLGGGVQFRCGPCGAKARAKVRGNEAYCPTCETWKAFADFSPSRRPGRPVHKECRTCDNARRRQFPIVRVGDCADGVCVSCGSASGLRHKRECAVTESVSSGRALRVVT